MIELQLIYSNNKSHVDVIGCNHCRRREAGVNFKSNGHNLSSVLTKFHDVANVAIMYFSASDIVVISHANT